MRKVDSKFKVLSENVAFKAFMKTMKKYNLFFPVFVEIYKFIQQDGSVEDDGRKIEFIKGINLPLDFLSKGMNFKKLHEKLSVCIENNVRHHLGRSDSEYDYLVHCVNTMIQVFIEFRLLKHKQDNVKIKIPNFEVLGREIFNIAAKKLFGDDFKLKEPKENKNLAPQNEEESIFVYEKFNEYTSNGIPIQEAINRVQEDLLVFRGQSKKTKINAENYYISNDYDDDFSYEIFSDPFLC